MSCAENIQSLNGPIALRRRSAVTFALYKEHATENPGFEWIIPTQPSTDPCTTTSNQPCTTTTDLCTCHNGESLHLLYVKADHCENNEHPVCPPKPKRIKTHGDGDYMYMGYITVARSSDVLVAAGFTLRAGWSCAIVWKSCANPTPTLFAPGIPFPTQEINLTC